MQNFIRVPTQIHTRELDRLVAHKNMERAGIKHVNRHDYYGPLWERTIVQSYFAKHWRDTVTVPTIDLRRKNRRNYIGVELNPKYKEIADKRLENTLVKLF